jgi:glyoxylase-like metal-dependent hydrolase (beta-lactamase superfamily II)
MDIQLSPHVTVISGAKGGKYPDGNSTMIRGSEGIVLIDPSLTVHDRGGVGVTVDRVLISHAHEDHMSGVGAVGATHVCTHEADLIGVQSLDGFMQVYGLPAEAEAEWRATVEREFNVTGWPTATGFADGDVFDLGDTSVSVMHLPGHTRGHSAFVVEGDGVAFIGDVDLSTFGPYYGDHWSDLAEFEESLVRIRDLDAAYYVTFHHKGVVKGRDEFLRLLDLFESVIARRDDALMEMLEQPRPFADLLEQGIIYRAGSRPPVFGESVERRSITMHLDRLIAADVVVDHEGLFLLK